MTPENLLSEWSRLLVESLADAGVRDVIVSPGSRSTPLAWAVLSSSRLRAISIVDERDAGFHALGRAKMTGVPCAVICTSGSAAANYFPAVVEASLSYTPLVVVTADRPFELMDCAAPQTLDQNRLYGEYVRRFAELGMPDAEPAALVGLRRRVLQAVFDATGREPGPVHLNVHMRKPLEPAAAATEAARALVETVDGLLSTPATRVFGGTGTPPGDGMAALGEAASASKRGLVVCGPANAVTPVRAPSLAHFAKLFGCGVYAETTSQLRFAANADVTTLDGLDLLLRAPSFAKAFRPDFVLQLGPPPTSSAWERFVAAHPEIPRYVLAASGFPDPHGTARAVVVADVDATLQAVTTIGQLMSSGRRSEPPWKALNDAAWAAVDAELADGALSEGAAIRVALRALPPGGVFAVGNSLPVRHADAFCRGTDGTVAVWSQRGVSGIDGVVAGAAGAAEAAQKPTVLVVGDVSALHDLGGFAAAAMATVPFVVVILNNDGGRIFEQLPLGKRGVTEDRFRYWTTPHGSSFEGLEKLFRLKYAQPKALAALERLLDEALGRAGCTVLEVPVPPHGAEERYTSLAARVEANVAPLVKSLAT
jgi:2-succinyl-5-enolpyruvyl-6-hydroxy-3-cyclohexene-1-carboxylate synthase